jgi:hypothetical protein
MTHTNSLNCGSSPGRTKNNEMDKTFVTSHIWCRALCNKTTIKWLHNWRQHYSYEEKLLLKKKKDIKIWRRRIW